MIKNILYLFLVVFNTQLFSQNISFSFVNARNTNDGTNDFYEADIYIASDSDFIVGSGQIYFNYNIEAFGENVHTNGNIEMLQPDGSVLATSFFGGTVLAYTSFIVNDNTTSRVSTSFQQLASSGTIGMPVISSTPKHLYSIKIKYTDVSKDPNVSFETGGVFLDQFYTACGPATVVALGTADCTKYSGTQITGDNYDSSGAALPTNVNWTGSSSAFWGVTSNWTDTAIPNVTNNVTIPDVTNDPIVNSGNYSVNDLTIATGADLTIDTNGTLNVNGNLNSSGTIALASNTSNSSVFIVEGTTSGQVTFQKNGLIANQWNVITASVSGQSIKEFAENVANDIRVNNSVSPKRYAIAYYDDSNTNGAKWVYYTADDLSTNALTFEVGKGYAISRATDGGVSFTGSIETNNVTETVAENQWNALGNPYTAYLPINENSGANFIQDNYSKFDASFVAVYSWDASQNKYTPKTLVDSESKLAPGEGFFIKTGSGETNVVFNENQRGVAVSGGGSMRLESTNASYPSIELKASIKGTMVTTKILYTETATKGLDAGYDIGNFEAANFDVFTQLVSNETKHNYTIQSLPNSDYDNMVIPVGLLAEDGTEVEFSVATNKLPTEITIYLEDKVKNTFTNLSNTNYNVTIEEEAHKRGRFYLHTISNTLSIEDSSLNSENIDIFKSANKEITITGIQSKAHIKVYSIIGREVLDTQIESNSSSKITLQGFSSGIYIVKLQSEDAEVSKKIIIE
ncbi:conserved protein of unknown function precursor containing a type A C-terminal secretion signal [Tenacibaculum sp. 190524A02b]|uniref:T9SS type A sorting domain-containing protein n=1 Tax=Tenacibaculum vairaonense TaxID=3137860 RepID=UPI0032B22810